MSGEVCAMCGRLADAGVDGDPPLAWTTEVHARGGTVGTCWYCTDCTRRHVRSIEAKLDQEWW